MHVSVPFGLPLALTAAMPPSAAAAAAAASDSSPRRLKPYLGPRAHLSLSWLSQHFLALLLVLITLAYLLALIPVLVRDAKDSLEAACAGVEGAASVAVSMPHYMADGVNELNVKAINALTDGAGTILDLLLQALEAIVIFMIDMYRSLYLCLLDLAVHGSITVLVAGIQEAQEFVTEAMQGIRTTIQDAVGGVNSGLKDTVGLLDKLPGVNIQAPQVDIPQLAALENVTLPNTLVDKLTSLNSTLPTLDQFRSSLDALVLRPIEDLRATVNSTLRSSPALSVELLPVPAKETVQLCGDLDTSWIDDVGHDLKQFVRVAIGLVLLAMALFVAANAVWERYRYRVFLGGVDAAREAWLRDLVDSARVPRADPAPSAEETLSQTNLLSFLNASAHPTLFRHASRLTSLLSRRRPTTSSSSKWNARANLIWFLSYVDHPYAWGFLALGLVGLVVVQIQLAVLDGPVRDLTHERAQQGAGEFSESVVGTLNERMREATGWWANETNRAVLEVQDGINNHLFGWVNTTTVTLNSTMNGFYDEITSTITEVFNGTVLEDPALGLVYCLVGSKVDALSTAFTWVHDHAHLTLPTVSPSILLLSPNRSQDLTSSLTNPNSTVSAPSIADKMIDAYLRSLEQQRTGFLAAIGIWGWVLLMGLFGAWWRAVGQDRWRRWRGRSPPADNDEDGAVVPEAEKAAVFRPLHLRSASNFGWGKSASTDSLTLAAMPPSDVREKAAPPAFAVEPAPPTSAGHTDRHTSPSSRSWASLVDFFRPPDEGSSRDPRDDQDPAPSQASDSPAAGPSLKPLALPVLPSLRRREGPSFSSAKLPAISQPRPLLHPFRVLREGRAVVQQRRRDRRRESDLVLLRDEGWRKEGAVPPARPGRAYAAAFGGGSKHMRASSVHLSFEDPDADGPERADEPDAALHPPLPPYPSRPPLLYTQPHPVHREPSSPSPPRPRHSTPYIPSGRPPLAATNPFATPFDE